ncbi:DUF2911 domain-containing protein [Flavobacteriaceae bacterium]|nr:DUF2911 domain-containing protein [Flavobacteriaceae bacterium]
MKKMRYLLVFVCSYGLAQIQTLQPSPSAKIEQVVGLTNVTIDYSRPAKRDRKIMGELVPMGEIWRAGANENSTLSFSDPVKVGGKNLDAGTYSLFIRPGKSMWEVFFYTETDNWGLPEKWNTESIAVVVETEIIQLKNTIESFTISLDDLYNNGANINIKWENTKVSIPIEVPTHSKMMSSITKTIKKDPKSRDYYNAAIYYRQSNQDLNQAKKWIAKAIEMDPDKFWMYRQQSLILAQLNEKDIAIAAAKTSLKLAQEAGNMDYVRLNTKSIKEWSN